MSSENKSEVVKIEVVNSKVKIIKLNRPECLNAMSVELITELYERLDELSRDNECQVVILTGEGRGFCSGLDLEDYGIIPGIDGMTLPRIAMRAIEYFSEVTSVMRRLPQPIIAAINGAAYGGGFCLSLGADIRICSEDTVFNATGIVNGLTSAELGASFLLPRLIGFSRANDIMLTGRTVAAEEAESMGLVSRVYPKEEVLDQAITMANQIASYSYFGTVMTKSMMWSALETPGMEACVEMENRNQILMGHTNNLPECIRARREKKKPVYTDQVREY